VSLDKKELARRKCPTVMQGTGKNRKVCTSSNAQSSNDVCLTYVCSKSPKHIYVTLHCSEKSYRLRS